MGITASGTCSFCDSAPDSHLGLLGVEGRDARICRGCLDLCQEILAGSFESTTDPAPIVEGNPSDDVGCGAQAMTDRESRAEVGDAGGSVEAALRAALKNLPGYELVALPNRNRYAIRGPKRPRPAVSLPLERVCSFCENLEEATRSLIAGPSGYICDECVARAGAVLAR